MAGGKHKAGTEGDNKNPGTHRAPSGARPSAEESRPASDGGGPDEPARPTPDDRPDPPEPSRTPDPQPSDPPQDPGPTSEPTQAEPSSSAHQPPDTQLAQREPAPRAGAPA